MLYHVYKITNKINGKYYIGVHKSANFANDDYYGSGVLIKKAVQKCGVENFVREILFVTDVESEAYQKEFELVEVSDKSYNLNAGGRGGWDYVNSLQLPNPMHDPEIRKTVFKKKQDNAYAKQTAL